MRHLLVITGLDFILWTSMRATQSTTSSLFRLSCKPARPYPHWNAPVKSQGLKGPDLPGQSLLLDERDLYPQAVINLINIMMAYCKKYKCITMRDGYKWPILGI